MEAIDSYIENTGTGSGFSAENFAPLGAVIENCYITTVSGTGITLNYADGVARNCTVITTSGSGISGGTAINCYAFSNSGRGGIPKESKYFSFLQLPITAVQWLPLFVDRS